MAKSDHNCSQCEEYMNAMVVARRVGQKATSESLHIQEEENNRRDEIAKALGISVAEQSWWDKTTKEKHLILLGRIRRGGRR